MSNAIDLPIPRDYPKRDAEIQRAAENLTKDSIVTQALERYLIQVLTEVHESRIRPLQTVNAEMLAALKSAEIAVEELCHGQDPANQCWVVLAEIRAAIASATA